MNKTQKRIIALLMTFTMIFSLAIPVAAEEASEAKVIEILSFNDFHGALAEGSKDLGYAKMVGYINEFKAENPNTVVVSAGDNYNGTAISNLTHGEPVNEMFKAVELLASAVGNHEFDWGPDKIPTWAEQGGFTFVASNIYETETYYPPKPQPSLPGLYLPGIDSLDQSDAGIRQLRWPSADRGCQPQCLRYSKTGRNR